MPSGFANFDIRYRTPGIAANFCQASARHHPARRTVAENGPCQDFRSSRVLVAAFAAQDGRAFFANGLLVDRHQIDVAP
jgi:hypothetical protein